VKNVAVAVCSHAGSKRSRARTDRRILLSYCFTVAMTANVNHRAEGMGTHVGMLASILERGQTINSLSLDFGCIFKVVFGARLPYCGHLHCSDDLVLA
jgi:hypothetical protein